MLLRAAIYRQAGYSLGPKGPCDEFDPRTARILVLRRSPEDLIGLGHISDNGVDNPITAFIYGARRRPPFPANEWTA